MAGTRDEIGRWLPHRSAPLVVRWGWRLALAVVVLVVTLYPSLRFRVEHADGFRGIDYVGSADGEFHVQRVIRTAAGEYGADNDVVHEYRGNPGTQDPVLAFWLVSLVTGSDPEGAAGRVLLATAVAAALGSLLLVRVGRAMALDEPAALALGAVCSLVPFVWSFTGTTLYLFHPTRQLIDYLPLFRPVQPAVSNLLLWIGLAAAIRSQRRVRLRDLLIAAAAAALGVRAYVALGPLLGGLLFCVALCEAARRRWRRLGVVVALGVCALAVQVWDTLAVIDTSERAVERATTNLVGVPYRGPIMTANLALLVAVAAVAVWLRFRGRITRARAFAAVAPAALVFLGYQQQLVTGKLYQPFHYDWFYVTPFTWIAVGALAPWCHERLSALSGRLSGSGAWRHLVRGAFIAAGVVVVVAVTGRWSGRLLQAVGLIRADELRRPVVFAALGVGVFLVPIGLLALGRARRLRQRAACVAAILAGVAIFNGLLVQKTGYLRRVDQYVVAQEMAPALEHLRGTADPQDVVACIDADTARFVLAHTGRNLLISGEERFFALGPSLAEQRERWLVNLKLFGMDDPTLRAAVEDTDNPWHYAIYGWRAFDKLPRKMAAVAYADNPFPLAEEDRTSVLAMWRELSSLSRRQLLARFRLDYVLWVERYAQRIPGIHAPEEGPDLKIEAQWPGITLYRVVP